MGRLTSLESVGCFWTETFGVWPGRSKAAHLRASSVKNDFWLEDGVWPNKKLPEEDTRRNKKIQEETGGYKKILKEENEGRHCLPVAHRSLYNLWAMSGNSITAYQFRLQIAPVCLCAQLRWRRRRREIRQKIYGEKNGKRNAAKVIHPMKAIQGRRTSFDWI